MKPGGWEKYKEATNDIADRIIDIVDSEENIDEVIKKVGKLEDKAKFKAFDKTKVKQMKPGNVKNKVKEYEPIKAQELLARQSEQLEREILEIKSSTQGRASRVFKMKSRLGGCKKGAQDSHAIKDPKSGELLVASEEIKRATLEYNCEVLKNNVAEEGFEELVKLKEELHDKRMENKIGKGTFVVEHNDFDAVVQKFKKKGKQSYDFLVKSGENFKHAVYKLCKRIIDQLEIPGCFDLTILQQIYKGKGIKADLSNSRFIHLKEWLPRTCDALVVGGMKSKILESSTKFQIGGQPGHRSQEHLFSLKCIIALRELRGEGFLFQLFDLSKFFDKESLRDVLDTLHEVGVDAKAYMAWYLLNRNTRIAVKTGTGLTEEADVGEVVGQGTVGGALTSQLNIDRGIERYFCGSRDEATYGTVRLQPMVFQDDIARIANDIASAKAGNHKLSFLMKEKQLKVHPDKTGFIAIGTKDYQQKIANETNESPIMFGEIVTKSKESDKYLGDIIHRDGLAASVEATIRDRKGRITSATLEIKAVIDDYRMQALGGMMGGWDLWNMAVVPSLLNNCSTWIGISDKQEDMLETVQEKFIRLMLEVPMSTPKVALRAETGLRSMKHRIWAEKINLIQAIRKMEGGLAKEIYEEQVEHDWPGLAKEVSSICSNIGMPDVNWNLVNKKDVDKAVTNHDKKETMEKFEKYKKLDKIIGDDPTIAKDYMKQKCIADTRLIFRLRTEMLDVKDNMRNKYKKTSTNCDACDMGTAESQAHVMVCPGYADVRVGKDLDRDRDLVSYFREVMLLRERNNVKK